MLNEMTFEERKNWEETLGFKSYDRLIHEIIDAEFKLNSEYEGLPKAEQLKLLKSKNVKKHSELTLRYAGKGIIYFQEESDGSESMDYVYLPFSKVLNEEGFLKIGNRIIQYTENKFKVIEDGDFSKISQLKELKEQPESRIFFVADIKELNREKILQEDDETLPGGGNNGGGGETPPSISFYSYGWSGVWRISGVEDKKKIRLCEFWLQHSFGDGTFITEYSVTARPEKKNIWGNWVPDETRLWIDGHGQIINGADNPHFSYDINDVTTKIYPIAVYQKTLPEGQYPNYHFVPYVANTCYWKATRWGGAHGIWVSVTDHKIKRTNN